MKGKLMSIGWGLAGMLLAELPAFSAESAAPIMAATGTLRFINTAFENASPLNWEIDAEGRILISLIYDHERSSPNRANGHWFFQVEAEPGASLTILLQNFDNIWNGRWGSPVSDRTNVYLSADAKEWTILPAQKTKDNRIHFTMRMESDKVFVARMPPYRLSDLEKLKKEIASNPLVEITPIGRTVEGRELEIIRAGKPDAPFRVLIRARAHPWEAGGNWVVEGFLRQLLKDDEAGRRCRERYCAYIMPMANKDGVARGYTRFNVLGMDLNRKWDIPADPRAPENQALEAWLGRMIAQGQRPHLAIDLHNDNGGNIHVSRPDSPNAEAYLANMEHYEKLMRKYTWFTEGSTGKDFRNPGSFGEGLLERFGVNALVQELNCDWIAGLNKAPEAKDWELLGAQYCEVFYRYFGEE
ncbi:MAG: M14 family zinc carboxypeptidase [Candidatus Omnitrophota bacterium]